MPSTAPAAIAPRRTRKAAADHFAAQQATHVTAFHAAVKAQDVKGALDAFCGARGLTVHA